MWWDNGSVELMAISASRREVEVQEYTETVVARVVLGPSELPLQVVDHASSDPTGTC